MLLLLLLLLLAAAAAAAEYGSGAGDNNVGSLELFLPLWLGDYTVEGSFVRGAPRRGYYR